MCVASFEISSMAEYDRKRICWSFFSCHSRECHKRVTHWLKLYFQFVLCLVIILLCGKDGMPGLRNPILCAISETCPDAKVRQQWKGTFPSYLSTACIWTYVRMPENLQCSFVECMLSKIYSSKQRWQDSSHSVQPNNVLYRTEDLHLFITCDSLYSAFFIIYFKKMEYLCHFKKQHPPSNINNYILIYRKKQLVIFLIKRWFFRENNYFTTLQYKWGKTIQNVIIAVQISQTTFTPVSTLTMIQK